MARKPAEIRIYVSWVDPERDPWPAVGRNGLGGGEVTDKVVVAPDSDSEWPGAQQVAKESGRLLRIGPTLLALFHGGSPYCNAKGLHHVYLLHRHDAGSERAERMKESIVHIAGARRWGNWTARVSLIPINRFQKAADDADIDKALNKWVCGSWHDPLFQRYRHERHVVVNCTSGEGSEGSWLQEFDWELATKDGLGKTTVTRIVERDGLRQNGLVEETATDLFREVKSGRQKYDREYRRINLSRHREK